MSRRGHKSRDSARDHKSRVGGDAPVYQLSHFSARPQYSPFEQNVLDKLSLVVEELRIKPETNAQALMRLVGDMIRQVQELLKVNDNNRENMIIMSLMSQFETNPLFNWDATAWIRSPYSPTLKALYNVMKKEVGIRITKGEYTPILALNIFEVTRSSVEAEHSKKMKDKDVHYESLQEQYAREVNSLQEQHAREVNSLQEQHANQLALIAKDLQQKDIIIRDQKEDLSQLNIKLEKLSQSEVDAGKGLVEITAKTETIADLRQSNDRLNQEVSDLKQIIRAKDDRIEQLTNQLINVALSPRAQVFASPQVLQPAQVLPGSVRSSDFISNHAPVLRLPGETGEKAHELSTGNLRHESSTGII
jgi:hypothetical protein